MEPNSTVSLSGKPLDMIDFEDDDQVFRAMQRGISDALRRHKENGQYIVVSSREGKPVIIPPEEIVVPVED